MSAGSLTPGPLKPGPLKPGPLTPEVAYLVRLSGALATRDPAAIRDAMAAAHHACDPDAVEEVILESYLFLGYPAALTAFRLWREVSGRQAQPHRPEGRETWRFRGEEICRAVFGNQYEALRQNVAALHPDLGEWMVEEGYGKVLGRAGLALPLRELCIIGLLAVSNVPEQLHSHLRGALAVGVEPEAVEAALAEVERYMMPHARDMGWARWREVLDRRRGRGQAAPASGTTPEGRVGREGTSTSEGTESS
jgi:4-carboxymuconolactone decarboxylase